MTTREFSSGPPGYYGNLVKEIYDTVNSLNSLVAKAVKEHGFSVFWDILLWIFGNTLNLFSQIGIVMLVGLAAKNGILIVEFANQLRDQGRSIHQAIVESASVRLRPILMTSIATVVGALPLVLAGGPGSGSRATIGVVVIFGVSFSTLLSLFMVPVFYTLLARYTRSPEAVAHELETLEAVTPQAGGNA